MDDINTVDISYLLPVVVIQKTLLLLKELQMFYVSASFDNSC